MKLLTQSTNYAETLNISINLNESYDKPVIFHCYWNGTLNQKNLISILSCYYFNVYNNKHRIILWLENNIPNKYNKLIEPYAEIKYFSLSEEINNSKIKGKINYSKQLSYYSDVIRYFLLYNYGGVWFDLDCLILRNFDPLFYHYGNEICVYQWETMNYPNGAIFISLEPKSSKMKDAIEFIIKRNRGWGFQEASLTYDLSLDFLVLPCSWFDPNFIKNPCNIKDIFSTVKEEYHFDNFFKGCFCYHWHNEWNRQLDNNSIILQLFKIICNKMQV